ncbi:MAG TPA: hypothetical protein VGC06_06895 [Actinomycetes bacterium]
MPQANDAELTNLYSAATNFDVEDNEPNTGPPGNPPAASFDLHVEAVAGNVIGNSSADYRLTLTAIDETLAAPNAGMSRTADQEFNAANGWNPGGGAGNFLKEQVFSIPVPNGVQGHVFRYVGTLVSKNGDIVSFIESNRFILV